MKYQDFVVQLGISPAGALQIRVQKSPAGEGEILLSMPAWLPELAFSLAGGLFRGSATVKRDFRRRVEEPPAAEEVGSQLHDLLFSGVVGRLWDQSLGALSGRRDTGLRLRLQIALEQTEFLGDLPWELLRNRDTGAYLGLDRRTPILRHLEVARPLLPQQLPASLKVLGVASAPQELASLDLAAEKQNLRTGKKRRGWQVSFLEQPTVEQLRRSLIDQGSHVLHFMGHGSFDPERREGALYFEDSQGFGAPFAGTALAAKLAGVPSLRLVVLNACETAVSGSAGTAYGGVAAALVRSGLPAVIAMQRPISDKAAIAFSSAFYRHLATGGDLEAALTEGRQAIHTLAPSGHEWSIPVLFSRATDDGLFVRSEGWRAWRWALGAAAAAALLALPPMMSPQPEKIPERPPPAAEPRTSGYKIELAQIFATGVNGVQGRLVYLEILEDGRMRLHFEFANGGEKTQVLDFDFLKTYLADEHGNSYEVTASSLPLPGVETVSAAVPARKSRQYWLEFTAPQDQARRLHVELASPPKSPAKFVPFEVALPSYPKELSVPSPPVVPLPNSNALAMAIAIGNGRKGVLSKVRKIEVAEKAMRVSLEMWNRSPVPIKAAFDPARIELKDLAGNILRPSRMGIFEGGKEKEMPAEATLRRAVRSRIFIDFPPPVTLSEKWELKLATRPDSEIRFVGTALEVTGSIFDRVRKALLEFARKAKPKLEIKERVDPPPAPAAKAVEEKKPPPVPTPAEASFATVGGGEEVPSSNEDLRIALLGVERLTNQRLRFKVVLANTGASPIEVPLWLGGTKLSDSEGRRFRLLASTFGEVGEGVADEAKFTLSPGEARELTFEFSGRVDSSEFFTFLLGSARTDQLLFRPIQTRVPEE